MIPEGPAFHKPKSIVAAKNLSYAALFIGVMAVIVRDIVLGVSGNGGALVMALTIAGFLIWIFLIKATTRCKKWARTLLVVWYCCIAFGVVFGYVHPELVTGIAESALLTMQVILQTVAIFFLYTKDSNVWFNSSLSPSTKFAEMKAEEGKK